MSTTLFLQIVTTDSPVEGINILQKHLKMPDSPLKKKKKRKESNISKSEYVLSSEAYQNMHKASAALKVDKEKERKKKKEEVQRRKLETLHKQKMKMEEKLNKINNVIDGKK
jgi:hypothetical protein